MNERPSKTKGSTQVKKGVAKSTHKSHLFTNQSAEGGLKTGSAAGSIGQKKPSRMQQQSKAKEKNMQQ